MSEDEAFVARLTARPDDETARLVYADWLDERDDPRGAYLRAEAEWLALQPQDAQYRPRYRDLSRRAATLDPVWLATAGRLAHVVRSAWASAYCFNFPPQPDPKPALAELRALYAEAFGADADAERFCLPADFLAFVSRFGGASNGFTGYFTAQRLVGGNRANVNAFGPTRSSSSEMWVAFGVVTEKRAYFVCADLGSPLFGVTAEGEDYHPWMAGIEPLAYRGRNLLHFFDGYVRAVCGCDPWWNVPHAQWATH